MPVFVGSHILHRGGLARSGERLALQIIFWPGNWREDVAEPRRRGVRPASPREYYRLKCANLWAGSCEPLNTMAFAQDNLRGNWCLTAETSPARRIRTG